MTPTHSGHVAINGLQVYVEVHGDLDGSDAVPLLLVPGAFLSTESMAQWVAVFAPDRPVIVFDQQGHGRTAETDRPMSYQQFGDDAAEVLRAFGVERADVMGYSQGGGVALQLAIRHPQLVRKLVSMSATYRQDGWYPVVIAALDHLTSDAFNDTPIGEAFRRHTTDPAAFDAYVEKMRILNRDDQQISDDEMRAIPAPTMVIVGDADGVQLEHAIRMFQLRGGGDEHAAATGQIDGVPRARLVVLPATSHIAMGKAVAVLAPMITDFLDDVPPPEASLF